METNVNVNSTEVKVKVCSTCKTEKPIEEFGKLAASKDGHLSFCKECNRSRNKKYRLSVIDVVGEVVKAEVVKSEVIKAVVASSFDWSTAPIHEHEVRVNNDCVIGDYFKNVSIEENFILKVIIWDRDENDERKTVSEHMLYITVDEWKKLLEFEKSEQMKLDLACVTEPKWTEFFFRYTKAFGLAKPNNLLGLRFKKHGSQGKCVNIGFNLKNLPALESMFSK